MNAQELRSLLEKTDNKFSILASFEIISKSKIKLSEFYELIRDFLSDEEKLRLFDYSHFRQFGGNIKKNIISLVSDENIILQMINDDDIINGITNQQIVDIIKSIGDFKKQQLLNNQEFIDKYQSYLKEIISSLGKDSKTKILMDVDLVKNKLHLKEEQIVDLVKGFENDYSKEEAIQAYKFEKSPKMSILTSCSNNYKMEAILNDNDFKKYDIIHILQTLDAKSLSRFLVEHREFLNEKDIVPYKIVQGLDPKDQKEFAENLESVDLSLNEKRKILATLNSKVKCEIDTTNFKEEYKSALSLQKEEYGLEIIVDFDRNLEDYRGLDDLIMVNPEKFTNEQRTKLMELCDICPNMQVASTLYDSSEPDINYSTGAEYKCAEEWVSSVLDNLDPKYSKAQKIALIDNSIGKKISYSPDFDTEVASDFDCRSLWKIISTGYGVCNGIARVEQYVLNRAGIESKIISSKTHAFLKLEDIELPLASGETLKGNTILDPTWNLVEHRFGAKPNNFCISYEQARKNDIDIEGKDHKCHKNDEKLQDATLNLDEQSLRNLFASVGLADINGQFPIKNLLDKSKSLDELYASKPEENINSQFMLLRQACPEFATCQNSSMSILSGALLDNENLKFNKCVVDRVYDKEDKEKRPVMFVYIDSDELGSKFYFANKEEEKMQELPPEKFKEKFECYEYDLIKRDGRRPWEFKEQENIDIDLSRSSGKIVAEEDILR